MNIEQGWAEAERTDTQYGAKRAGQVGEELDRQEKELAGLSHAISDLEMRLSLVLRLVDDAKVAEMSVPREEFVPLADRIRNFTDDIVRCGRRVQFLTERVEL